MARELAQQLVNNARLAIAALKEIYRATSEMPVKKATATSQRRAETYYPSVLHSEDALEGPRKTRSVWKVVNVTMPDGASLIRPATCATVGRIDVYAAISKTEVQL
ncbi:hypothetical protein KCP73_07875 [Salmonella enterica subsp. enterica]|nr:hypothetical protein KCP73_07875 [Salmonella enterica subsp. enterica]